MFNIGLKELWFILPIVVGTIIVLKTKNISVKEKFIWILSVLIFNILAIIAFFIWKKPLNKT
jgi:hypothetical protein